MEKIKLSNETEYFVENPTQNGDNLSLTFCGLPDYASFRNTLNEENLEVIEVYSEGGVLSTVFEGYTTLTGKFDIAENDEGTMDVTVYLKKPDPVLQEIAGLKIEIAALKAAQSE